MKQEINPGSPSCLNLEIQAITYAGSRDFVHIYLDPPRWEYMAGQFVMIRPDGWVNDPIWPRPFSICEKTDDSLRLFVQVVGRGTSLISQLQPGNSIDLWGPLGNGFVFDPQDRLLILAGGMGIAPFVGLCKKHPHPEQISFLFGHRMDIESYPLAEFPPEIDSEHLKQETTADIQGFQGVLKTRIQNFSGRGMILACGPTPFLKVVQQYSLEFEANTLISLENKMACGVGACLGCVAQTTSGDYVQTCTRGPVFRADEVVLDEQLLNQKAYRK